MQGRYRVIDSDPFVAMTPFAERLAEKLGTQVHKRCIKTDEYLRVKGIPDGSVFAIGDCATIENPRLLEHIMDIFHRADKAHDGLLTFEEFCTAVHDIRTRYPLTQQHLGEMMELFNTYDKDKNGRLDLEEMRIMLHDIDSKVTHLPAVILRKGILNSNAHLFFLFFSTDGSSS